MRIASKEFVIKKLVELITTPKKKYSQNFLIDEKTVSDIVDALDVKEDEIVIEVGPGLGALTEEIVSRGYILHAFEIDETLVPHLNKYFEKNLNFTLHPIDFMKEDLKEFKGKKVRVISNLPYNLTTPMIEKIALADFELKSFEFMVQKEVYSRLNAKVNSKEYSPLVILLNYLGRIKIVSKVSKDKFFPIPNVDSIVLKLEITKENRNSEYEKKLYNLLTLCFTQRRKTINNNLLLKYPKEVVNHVLNSIGLDPRTRPEQITLETYLKLLNQLP